MKALVIGASGLVGGALMRVLAEQDAEALGTYHNRPSSRLLPLDISDPQAVSERIGTLKPKVVYLAGALGRRRLL